MLHFTWWGQGSLYPGLPLVHFELLDFTDNLEFTAEYKELTNWVQMKWDNKLYECEFAYACTLHERFNEIVNIYIVLYAVHRIFLFFKALLKNHGLLLMANHGLNHKLSQKSTANLLNWDSLNPNCLDSIEST